MKKGKIKKLTFLLVLSFTFTVLFAACAGNSKLQGDNSEQENLTTKELTQQQNQNPNDSTNKPGETANPEETVKPETTPTPKPKDIKVRALYLTGWTVGSMEKVQHYVDLTKNSDINSYVVDIKDDDGYIGYESSIPEVRKIKAWEKKYDVDKVIKKFHDNNIHVIGRVVCFKDPILSSKRPELAIKNTGGGLWRDNHGLTWLNPYNRESWPYLVAIAKEGVKKGFDEIQFDYIRFANDGNKKAMNFGDTKNQQKYEVINEFLSYAKKEMPGVVLSADVFGIICESPADTEGIGQNLEYVGKEIEYISPMVYPSHYAVGQKVNGVIYTKPDLDPYGVVYNTLVKAKERISKVDGYKAKIRPYLQDFTASWLGKGYYQSYGSEQAKQQIKAVYDAGLEEWIFWDAGNTYSEQAFIK